MHVAIKDGDLLDQPVEVIVNAWNRNFIPWWLLLPQGVSGAIKRRGGYEPFRELSRRGILPLGGAVLTGPGRLPFRGIIHVAGIGFLWRSSEESIRKSVHNALVLATQQGFRSVAFPLIGAGTGGGRSDRVQAVMEDEIQKSGFSGEVLLVRYRKGSEPDGAAGASRFAQEKIEHQGRLAPDADLCSVAMRKQIAIPFWLFIVLWIVTLLLPLGVHSWSPVAGSVVGVILPILWLTQMPASCRGGALIAFPMAMLQLGSGLAWLSCAIRMLTR